MSVNKMWTAPPVLEYIGSLHVKHGASPEAVAASTANLRSKDGFGRYVFPVTGPCGRRACVWVRVRPD